jgi:hypothetical protein
VNVAHCYCPSQEEEDRETQYDLQLPEQEARAPSTPDSPLRAASWPAMPDDDEQDEDQSFISMALEQQACRYADELGEGAWTELMTRLVTARDAKRQRLMMEAEEELLFADMPALAVFREDRL